MPLGRSRADKGKTKLMQAIHWAPVNRAKNILRNGIRKSRNGFLYCFPYTGIRELDKWWPNLFNRDEDGRQKMQYHGFVFRLQPEDLPAYIEDSIIWNIYDHFDPYEYSLNTLEDVKKNYQDLLANRFNLRRQVYKDEETRRRQIQELKKNPAAMNEYMKDIELMKYALEEIQMRLSGSIPASRIIKVIPFGDEHGRVLRKRKKYREMGRAMFDCED